MSKPQPQTITLRTPDDWHYHFRDEHTLQRTVPDAALQFQRVIAMPNTQPPITSVTMAEAYRQRILQHRPTGNTFEPRMTLYLTEHTSPSEVAAAATCDYVQAIKLYPAGATTGSAAGIKDYRKLYPIFSAMQQHDVPLQVHAEVNDPTVDCFEREAVFIERHLQHWVKDFPELRLVMEHVTSRHGVAFVQSCPAKYVGATITPHHLWCNRNDLLAVRIRPHYYCLPILKRAEDQQALINAATGGDAHFFLGSDGAPHAIAHKESSCGCAGIYHGPHTLELYAALFDQHQALSKLEDFCSVFGANFYKMPLNTGTVTLQKTEHQLGDTLKLDAEQQVKLFFSGKTWPWKLINNPN